MAVAVPQQRLDMEIAAAVVEEVHEMATNIYKVDMLAGWTCEQ